MDAKRWGLAALVVALLCAASFGAGRYSKPARVEETTQVARTAEVQATSVATEHRVEAPVRVTTRTVRRPAPEAPPPAGCPACEPVEETVRVEERGPVVVDRTEGETVVARSTEDRTTKTVTINDQPRILVGASLQWNWNDWQPQPTYLFQAGYRFAGPLWVTGFAATNGAVGAGLLLTF